MVQAQIICGGTSQKRQETIIKIIESRLGKVNLENSPDIFIVSGTSSIGIDQVKDLEKKLKFKPYSLPEKVAIIYQAEKLTLPAQNAILKTLEEPPDHTFLILETQKVNLLIPTIISRCEITRIEPEEYQPSQDDLSFHQELFVKIGKAGVGERLKIAGLYSKNKEEAADFIKKQIILCRDLLLKNPKKPTAKILHEFQSSLLLLEKNVNPSLVIGNLLLKYPCIKRPK